MKKYIYLLALLSLFLAGCGQKTAETEQTGQLTVANPNTGPVKSDKTTFRIAWSRYTGWEPWALAEQNGILKKWADKNGIKIELVYVDNYIGSIERYTKGEFDGCTMTNIDALTLPAAGGLDSTALIVGDYSNGNDGIVAKAAQSIAGVQGRDVKLVEFSVSHYLLDRASGINGISANSIKIVNTPETDIASQFAADTNGAVVTWNPHLSAAEAAPGAKTVFSSADIQGEILDLMVVRSDSPDSLRKALVGAWYETMALLASDDATQRKNAIEYMATNSGTTAADFERQLETTAMFYFPWDGASFAVSPSIRDTMDRVREFGFRHKLLGQNAKSADAIGIELADGTVMGDSGNIKLRFDDQYMQSASLGTLK